MMTMYELLAGVKTLRHFHDTGVLKVTKQKNPDADLYVMKGIVEGIYASVMEERERAPDPLGDLIVTEVAACLRDRANA